MSADTEPWHRGPIAELRAFLEAALFDPVPGQHPDPPERRKRRRIVVAVTLVLGTAALAFALRIPPGDSRFYYATIGLALVWGVGALVSGPLHVGWGHTRRGNQRARPIVQSLALGALLLGIFLVGALVVARIPFLREPVDDAARPRALRLHHRRARHHGAQRRRRGALLPGRPVCGSPSPRRRRLHDHLRAHHGGRRCPPARRRRLCRRDRHRSPAARHRRHPRADHHARDVVQRHAPAPSPRPQPGQVIRVTRDNLDTPHDHSSDATDTERDGTRTALVTGASGYVGGHLVPRLLDEGWSVRVLTRHASSLDDRPWRQWVDVVEGDVASESDMHTALRGIRTAWYLVHSMDDRPDFAERDREAAASLRGRCQARRRRADRLPRRAAPRGGGALPPPRLPRRGRRDLPVLGRPDGGAAGRRRPRGRLRVLRHAALPHDPAAGDDRARSGSRTGSSRSPSTTSSRCWPAPATCPPR